MSIHETEAFYQNQIDKHQIIKSALKKKHRVWTILRVVVFLIIPTQFFLFTYTPLLLLSGLAFLILFFIIVNIWVDSKRKIQIEDNHISLCKKEISALNGDWSSFGDGAAYLNGSHPFSFDMDVFGKNGLFTYLNRTVTKQGEKKLAATLQDGANNTEQANDNILFLSKDINWVHEFIATSQADKTETNEKLLTEILPEITESGTWSKIARVLIPVISIVSITAMIFGQLSSGKFILIFVALFICSRLKASKVHLWMLHLDNERYRIQALKAQMESLKKLAIDKENTQHLFNEKLYNLIVELSKIQVYSSYRMNAVANLLINGLFGWDAYLMDRMKKFQVKYFKDLKTLELHLADVEVWISGAKFAFNNPKHAFAKWTDGDFEMEQLAHPFVQIKNRVSNDFDLKADECAIILTGPNMAGKSTYLRCVGTGILLANAGFPILAKSIRIPKVELYTSMRTSDDLLANSSYFHAELHRLRFIVDAIESGKKVFFILDEILKGTNSKDKEEGSALFLEKLLSLKTQGIIATHDLSLTKLSNVHSEFKNFYFDSTITGDLLTFDYKIRAGVCQNMNASFLLKQLKLVN